MPISGLKTVRPAIQEMFQVREKRSGAGRRAKRPKTTSHHTGDVSAEPEEDEVIMGNVCDRRFTVRKHTQKRKLSM